jgi:1-acyl-sn-glycerol-3-phosphate acyltransferase
MSRDRSADNQGKPKAGKTGAEARGSARGFGRLGEALSGLREEIRTQQRRTFTAPKEDERGADWNSLFDELRKRVGTLGMVEHEPVVDEFGMEVAYLEQQKPFFDFMFERYWRVDLRGATRPKPSKPVVFVANLSGILPWDAMMLAHAIGRGRPTAARPRFLVQDRVLALPFAQAQLVRIGGVRSCRENLDELLAKQRSVIAFPESKEKPAHSYRDRYQVTPFVDTSAVLAAAKAGCAVVPVGIVGAEDATPRLGDMAMLAKLASRDLGIPKLPSTPVFPLLGPLGLLPLPAKWVISLGEPVPARTVVEHAETETALELNGVLRARIQALVESGLESRFSTWA